MFTFSSGYHVIKPVECNAYAGVVIDKSVTNVVLWSSVRYDRLYSSVKYQLTVFSVTIFV